MIQNARSIIDTFTEQREIFETELIKIDCDTFNKALKDVVTLFNQLLTPDMIVHHNDTLMKCAKLLSYELEVGSITMKPKYMTQHKLTNLCKKHYHINILDQFDFDNVQ